MATSRVLLTLNMAAIIHLTEKRPMNIHSKTSASDSDYTVVFSSHASSRSEISRPSYTTKLKKGTRTPPPFVGTKFVTRHYVDMRRVNRLQEYQSGMPMIMGLELGLNEHPLALHYHLQESLPPQIFKDVVSVLDTEMEAMFDADSEESLTEDQDVEVLPDVVVPPLPLGPLPLGPLPSLPVPDTFQVDTSAQIESDQKIHVEVIPPYSPLEKKRVVNPYRNLRKEVETFEDFEKIEREENRKRITHEFCEWVNSLGNENATIDEATVLQLFNTSFETKPPLFVPFNIVSLNSVPDELVLNMSGQKKGPLPSTLKLKGGKIKLPALLKKQAKKREVVADNKFRFGGWYLDPKLWTKLRPNQPLLDPSKPKDEGFSADKKKSLALDEELALSYGTQTFREFVDKKGFRVPEFLKRVQEIQKEAQKKREIKEVEPKRIKEKKAYIDKPREIVLIW